MQNLMYHLIAEQKMSSNLIFNKDNNGAEEIHKAIGMIDSDLAYIKWEPWLKHTTRQITSVIGKDVLKKVVELYKKEDANDLEKELVEKVQSSNALFAWLKIIPTLDAQHGNSGRQKRIAENERGLTAEEQFKDENNILTLAYESLDSLLDFLNDNIETFAFWKESEVYKSMKGLLISDLQAFNQYYTIDSFRLFVAILPWIKETQDVDIIPVLTLQGLQQFKEAISKKEEEQTDRDKKLIALKDVIYRPLVLFSMVRAFKRLPVQAIPEGLVQVQIVGTVKERIKATESAIKQQILNLSDDAQGALDNLMNELAQLNEQGDPYVSQVRMIGKGLIF